MTEREKTFIEDFDELLELYGVNLTFTGRAAYQSISIENDDMYIELKDIVEKINNVTYKNRETLDVQREA